MGKKCFKILKEIGFKGGQMNITDEQRKEAMDYVETKLDMGESIGWYDKKNIRDDNLYFPHHPLRTRTEDGDEGVGVETS